MNSGASGNEWRPALSGKQRERVVGVRFEGVFSIMDKTKSKLGQVDRRKIEENGIEYRNMSETEYWVYLKIRDRSHSVIGAGKPSSCPSWACSVPGAVTFEWRFRSL